jgi:serine O-acetyltransferase
MGRSLALLLNLSPGFRTEGILIMFDNLRVDIQRAKWDRVGTLQTGIYKRAEWIQTLRILMAQNTWSVIAYRFSHWATSIRVPVVKQLVLLVAVIFQRWVELWNGVFISRDAEIGPGLIIHTPYGICIGPTRIGANCTVGSGVLIAGGSRGVGDNVYFGPGAKLIGDAKIGNNVVILANSTVITDVGDNLTIMGVPARIRLPGGQLKRFPRQPVQKS